MKKYFRHAVAMSAIMSVAALSGCGQQEQPVEPVEVVTYETNPAPETELHAAQEENLRQAVPQGTAAYTDVVQTGWVQVEDSVTFSLSGPDNCFPEIETVTKEGATMSIHLSETPDDCSMTTKVGYFTVESAPQIEKVQIYEAGYADPFELAKLDTPQMPSPTLIEEG